MISVFSKTNKTTCFLVYMLTISFITKMKERFTVTIEDTVKKFVGCEMSWDKKRSVLLTQKEIIGLITEKFEQEL